MFIVYLYHYFFIHSSVDGHLGCFHVLALVNSAAVNNGIHVSFSILVSSGYIPRSGISGSYGGFISSFLRNLHTIFLSGCINLHSHHQCKSVPFLPHPLQHFLFADFLMMTVLASMRWYLIVILIFISLIRSSVEHLFMCCEPSVCLLWRNVCLDIFPTFWLDCLFFWYWVVWNTCIFWKLILCQLFHLLLFSPILRVVFSPCL